MKHYYREKMEEEWVVRFLKLLQDQFLLSIMAEFVGAEEVTVVESRKVVDVDLSCLGKDEERKTEKSLKFWPTY